MERAIYTVPFDFTPVTQKALEYAIYVGKIVGEEVEIKLTHVVEDEKRIEAASKRLDEIIEQQGFISGVTFSKDIRKGSIFTAINKSATEDESSIVFMGTHGMSGLQKFIGSYAMKVITGSELPFIVVQQETEIKDFQHLVIPIDYTGESIQITQTAAYFASAFNAKVSVVYEDYTDVAFRSKLAMRISLIKETYTQKNIQFEIKELKGKGNTLKKLLNYVEENNCDMIALSYFTEALFPQFDTFAQSLITNKMKLPCLIVNAVQTKTSSY